MELPDNNDLEKFIHAQLQKLPQHEAPASLVSNVLAAIATRKKLPWWRQSFIFWPRRVQSLLFTALGLVFAAVIYGTGRADNVSVPDVSEQLSSYAWIARTIRSVGEASFPLDQQSAARVFRRPDRGFSFALRRLHRGRICSVQSHLLSGVARGLICGSHSVIC